MPPERRGQDLVAEADAEDRHPSDEVGHRRGRAGQGGGITGPVGEEHAVGLERQDVVGGVPAGTTVTVPSVVSSWTMVVLTPKS